MNETISALDLVRTIAISFAIAAAIGGLLTILLRRTFGVKPEETVRAEKNAGRDGMGAVARFIDRVMPASEDQMGAARESLARAGLDMTPATLWTMRACCAAAGLALGTVLIPLLGGVRGIGAAALATIAAGMLPQLWIISKRSTWREAIEAQLPDAMDLMTIAMSAGSSFDNAIRCVADQMEGPLAEAFGKIGEEAKYSSRSEALVRFADRAKVPAVTVFAASITQAEKSGGSLVDVLRSQSETVRTQRRLKVEEKAGALSAKMIIPMIVFILPCFILVLITPMIFKIVETLG